jgi:hypothetical protein
VTAPTFSALSREDLLNSLANSREVQFSAVGMVIAQSGHEDFLMTRKIGNEGAADEYQGYAK